MNFLTCNHEFEVKGFKGVFIKDKTDHRKSNVPFRCKICGDIINREWLGHSPIKELTK